MLAANFWGLLPTERLWVSGTKMGMLPLASSLGDGVVTATPCSLVSPTPQHTQTLVPLLPKAPFCS